MTKVEIIPGIARILFSGKGPRHARFPSAATTATATFTATATSTATSAGTTAVAALAAALILSACAGSPPVRYYTLTEPLISSTADAAPRPSADYAIEVAPVSVPPQADQPQLMLRGASGELTAQYSDRWSAPLPDELRNALSNVLTRQLGALDVYQLTPLPNLKVWRIQVSIQRFDASTAGPVVIDATWRVRPLQGDGAGLLCHGRVEAPVKAAPGSIGLGAVVVAEQKAVALLGQTIAATVWPQDRPAVAATDGVQAPRCAHPGFTAPA